MITGRAHPRRGQSKLKADTFLILTTGKVPFEMVEGLDYVSVPEGTIVEAKVIMLPQAARGSASYWLPSSLPTTENDKYEKTAHAGNIYTPCNRMTMSRVLWFFQTTVETLSAKSRNV